MSAEKKTIPGHSEDGSCTESTPLTGDKAESSSPPKKLLPFTLELLMFLYTFPYVMCTVSRQNLILEKVCIQKLNLSEDICLNLTDDNSSYKSDTDSMGSNYNLYVNLIHMGPAAVLSLFIGPWSDKYSRKLPIMIALCGILIDTVGLILNAFFYQAPVEYFFLSSCFGGLTGGLIVVISTVYSCATETTEEKSRTLKYALLELCFALGMPAGTFAGGRIYRAYGYIAVFSTSVAVNCLALLWAFFVLKETRPRNKQVTKKKMLLDLFSVESIKDNVRTCLKKREDSRRAQLWLLMLSMCTIVVTYASFSTIAYVYAKQRYNWDVVQYSDMTTIFSIVVMAVMIFVVPIFTKVLKIRDPIIGLLGTVSMFGANICKAFASTLLLYYVGNGVAIFSGFAPLAVRSMLSKIMEKEELGKVFSMLSSFESLVPLAGSTLLTCIFTATVKSFPGLAYLVAASILIVPLCTFSWLVWRKSKDSKTLDLEVPSSLTANTTIQVNEKAARV